MLITQKYDRREIRDAFVFLAPALIIIIVFFLIPGIWLFIYSLTDVRLSRFGEFVGIQNFTRVLRSAGFLRSLTVSFQFMVIVTVLQTAIALTMAVLLNNEIRSTRFLRSFYFIPVILSFVVVGYIWRGLYNNNYGLINEVFSVLGLKRQKFLDDPEQALVALIVTCIWKTWPFFMMIFISGLKEIPASIYESAYIDGAGSMRRFFSLTVPLLKRTLLFVIVVTTMDSIVKVFVPVFVMTSGGPRGATDMLVHYAWRTAFRLGQFGMASAMAVVMFTFVLVINLIQLKIGNRNEN